ncbi:MAG: PilZ domain-containing protein [Spirochaetes bacterium]|nr:PilZ domain-containing protein [Spirochaetota bacterium]
MVDEKRRFIRHPLSYPLKTRVVRQSAEDILLHGESENIGGGGLLFKSVERVAEDAEVEINLTVENRQFRIDGVVVRCEPSGNGGYNIAVSFRRPDEALKARMMEQVVRIEEFKRRLERRCGKPLDFSWVAKQWIKRYSGLFARHYDI